MTTVSLAKMVSGQSGKIHSIDGGRGVLTRLEAMGLRGGVSIIKLSGQIMHGPVIVKVGNTKIALGFGLASKIIIALDD